MMRASGGAFVRESRLGWVVIDEGVASASLRELTIDALQLRLRQRTGRFALYAPAEAE